jgi:hypothetical protein
MMACPRGGPGGGKGAAALIVAAYARQRVHMVGGIYISHVLVSRGRCPDNACTGSEYAITPYSAPTTGRCEAKKVGVPVGMWDGVWVWGMDSLAPALAILESATCGRGSRLAGSLGGLQQRVRSGEERRGEERWRARCGLMYAALRVV